MEMNYKEIRDVKCIILNTRTNDSAMQQRIKERVHYIVQHNTFCILSLHTQIQRMYAEIETKNYQNKWHSYYSYIRNPSLTVLGLHVQWQWPYYCTVLEQNSPLTRGKAAFSPSTNTATN